MYGVVSHGFIRERSFSIVVTHKSNALFMGSPITGITHPTHFAPVLLNLLLLTRSIILVFCKAPSPSRQANIFVYPCGVRGFRRDDNPHILPQYS